ncbi:LacI family DNA-binding transcriptional regulator [Sinomonas sp. ASV322]|uniref:LacI family DNA-binding transcriptional regulator n=1 Tax=Sinomonas sp. ASV322 TaxID=3041920 RepID=UPI0027DD9E86|nr:LacI family DNA-binding transcriptional regulator [Sinomonas sp. ASV322]MDQ4503095.1 LacI family DNA-binding transcriptional regulator [Sinomonas sp. ASV322]
MNRYKAPTIVQLAKLLGVAPSTVSRAFTDPGKLLPETVDRVRRKASEIGYVPNNHARALITGRSSIVGLIVPDIANPFFPPILRQAQRTAEEQGLSLILADSDGDPERELQLVGRMTPQVEGLVLAASRLPEKSLVTIAERLPTVLVNRDVEGIPRVLVSADEALDLAVATFVRDGHRSLAYVGGPPESWSNAQRASRVERSAREHGLPMARLEAPGGTYSEGFDVARAVTSAGATAVIAFDDVIAHGLISGFQAAGLSVPHDVSVLGCDDTLSTTTYPPLSSISLDLRGAGRLAVETLRASAGPSAAAPARFELEGKLVLRGSTGRAPER